MSTQPVASIERSNLATHAKTSQSRSGLVLVFLGTLSGAAAQVLIKLGASGIGPHASPLETAVRILTNTSLFTGYSLYGITTVLLILALRQGQLSLLYPVIALTFVWVTVLSIILFHETMNIWKVAGVCSIMLGVAVLGRGSVVRAS